MNGKEMLESMSYVDEKYIADAEVRPKGRLHWQPVAAAAACLALVLVGVGLMVPGRENPMELAAGPRQAVAQLEEAAAVSGDIADQGMPLMAAAPKSVALPEMTVTVVAREGGTLRCTVETSGDGAFQPGQEITVLLPQENAEALPTRLHIFYTPAEAADTVTALSWEEAQDVPQE